MRLPSLYIWTITLTVIIMLSTVMSCIQKGNKTKESMCAMPGAKAGGHDSCMNHESEYFKISAYLTQITKISIVLEDMLKDPKRPCQYCGGFFVNIVDLSNKALEHSDNEASRVLSGVLRDTYSEGYMKWKNKYDPIEIADKIRAIRKKTQELYGA
ncbi:hypothetical protein TetV_279 [Tetraselmis virus 1]|uniref:Uncharacterized protein n=1 Tax=Tetraselmis virus 1 TaxID=2060617 RepID=A0A2P0VN99_9VIRU|nr:hypothetical protein QJ968_gp279 [Tetraselmis virus 1]AUF82371.1 hypothetical protein TetV_279 [Tetraselmis virus 1]